MFNDLLSLKRSDDLGGSKLQISMRARPRYINDERTLATD